MLWRKYWPGLAVAIPIGAAIGLVLGRTFHEAEPANLFPDEMICLLLGCLTALAAALGAILGTLLASRRTQDQFFFVVGGSVGAAAGVCALWLALTPVFVGVGGLGGIVVVPLIAVPTAVIAGSICAISMIVCDRVARSSARSSVDAGRVNS